MVRPSLFPHKFNYSLTFAPVGSIPFKMRSIAIVWLHTARLRKKSQSQRQWPS